MSYTYSNSTILDPYYIQQYVSEDGNFVVIPMIGGKKWALIVEGKPLKKVYRKFDTALKDVLKYKKTFDKSRKSHYVEF